MRSVALVAAGLGLLLLPSCASSRKVSATGPEGGIERSASVVAPLPQPPPPPPPAVPADTEPDLTEVVLLEATVSFEKGKALFLRGDVEEGRHFFDQALERLKGSGFDFFWNPHLERSYFKFLGEIQMLELADMINPSEVLPPALVPTPVDDHADLDLYTLQVDPHLREKVSQDLLESRFDIPVVVNDLVLRLLNYYQTRGRKVMEAGIRRSGLHMPLFREIFQEEGVPLDLIYLANVESSFKPNAYSRAKARGIWQFMVGTGRAYGLRDNWWIDERSDVRKSTRAAARHLKDLYEEFGDWNLVLAAYNAGGRRIERNWKRYGRIDYWTMVKRRLLPRETRNFVPSILASIIIFKHPGKYGFSVEPDPPLRYESIRLYEQVDLRVAAEEVGISVRTLFELNPELRRGITPYNFPDYRLKVPLGKGELLRQKLASLPAHKRVQFRHHRVSRGETLSVIASGYRSSIQAIAEVNRIRNIHRLQIGQNLIIPLGGSPSGGFRPSAGQDLPEKHVVRRGESLFKIARRYGVTVRDLLRWNNLKADGVIHPGQNIRILAKANAADGSASSPVARVAGDR